MNEGSGVMNACEEIEKKKTKKGKKAMQRKRKEGKKVGSDDN